MYELLDYTENLWGYPSLKNTAIIGVQHLLDSTLEIVRLMKRRGIDPQNVFLIGKAYSSSREVYHDLEVEGVHVSPDSFLHDSHKSFDVVFREALEKFLKFAYENLNLGGVDKIILLDDGGHLVKMVSQQQLWKDLPPVIAVEQTSSGYHLIKTLQPEFPVINIARSTAKLKLETPYIAESIVRRLQHHMPEMLNERNDVLILGKGVVGEEIGRLLRIRNQEVSFFDPSVNENSDYNTHISSADIVLGCSGANAVSFLDYSLMKKNVVLASASSSDREFSAFEFRKQYPKNIDPFMNYSNNGLTLLQSGFPINFWGTRYNISLRKMQITMALLSSGIFQGTSMKSRVHGIISHNQSIERKIIRQFQKIRNKYANVA